MSISERLKSARVAAGLTQRDVAQKCGVTQPTYCRWELNELDPAVEQAFVLTHELGVSLEWLVTGERPQSPCQLNVATASEDIRTPALCEALRLTAELLRRAELVLPSEMLALVQTPTKDTLISFSTNLQLLLDKYRAHKNLR